MRLGATLARWAALLGLAMASVPARADGPDTRSSGMAAYHAALAARRLDATGPLSRASISARLRSAQDLAAVGRRDEVISLLVGLVEAPRFADFADSEEGHATVLALGDALAQAGAYEPARGYLRRLLPLPPSDTYARRAVRKLVEIALDSDALDGVLADLALVPPAGQPEETRGEIGYLTGRQKQLAGDATGATAAFATVTQKSRFWASSVYLSGLIEVERGNLKRGEELFCKVADPKRVERTTALLADERFFAVRDLARLALGRVAHEQFRFDDSRYYYYLVPQDSDRIAEALYESATSRYEKKDYEGARALLDELDQLGVRHRYEDEAAILSAYLDLARCRFPEADAKLRAFLARYEPVRDAARSLGKDPRAMARLLESSRTGGDAASAETGLAPEPARSIAALVRVDAGFGTLGRRLALLDQQISGLRGSVGQLGDLGSVLATSGGVRPQAGGDDPKRQAELALRARAALDDVRHQLEAAERARAPKETLAELRAKLDELDGAIRAGAQASAAKVATPAAAGTDLPELLRGDLATASDLYAAAQAARAKLVEAQTALGADAIARFDLRISRLLRRARLGRIESVLGKKRALEVEVEALASGVLPQSSLDSLDAARYLKDSEEYWPFEGDDWPDEYVGGEGLR